MDAALLRQAGDAVAALADIVAAAKFCHKARRRLALGHLALVRPGVSPQAACYSAADALISLFRKSEVGTFDRNIWLASDSHWKFGPKGKPHVTAGGSQAARGGGGRRGRGRGRAQPACPTLQTQQATRCWPPRMGTPRWVSWPWASG